MTSSSLVLRSSAYQNPAHDMPRDGRCVERAHALHEEGREGEGPGEAPDGGGGGLSVDDVKTTESEPDENDCKRGCGGVVWEQSGHVFRSVRSVTRMPRR